MPLNHATLVRLDAQLETFFHLTSGISEVQLREVLVPGKWSVFEQMAHLVRYQEIFIQRLDLIVIEEQPVFDFYHAEKDPAWRIWQKADMNAVNLTIKDGRETVQKILKSFDESTLERVGVHPRFGAMDIPQWTEFFVLHESHHLYAIFRLIREYLS